MKLIKQMYAYNKYLTIYCGILIILALITIITIFGSTSTGMEGYTQAAVLSIFFVLLGIPLFLFIMFISFVFCLDLKRDLPTYFMKRKFKLKKKGKKELKSTLGLLGLMLIPLSILGFMSVYGVLLGIDVIKDYKYLDNPESIRIYNSYVERSYGRRMQNNWLHGKDKDGKEYKFRIGKYPDLVLPEKMDSIKVYYLPNAKVVMDIRE